MKTRKAIHFSPANITLVTENLGNIAANLDIEDIYSYELVYSSGLSKDLIVIYFENGETEVVHIEGNRLVVYE